MVIIIVIIVIIVKPHVIPSRMTVRQMVEHGDSIA
jgi:DNA-directed RNA polymerase beta subunit